MNYDHPELLEKLASEYVLGTMNVRVRRRFARHLLGSFAAQRAVAQWQVHLAPLHQSIAPMVPPPRVWQAIVRHTRAAPVPQGWRVTVQRWLGNELRPAMGLCLGVLLTLGLVLQAPHLIGLERPAHTLAASYVGVLNDAHDNAGLAVSSLRRGTIVSLKVFTPLPVPPNRVAVLWAVPANAAPVRVGVVGATGKSEIVLAAPAEVLFGNVSRLAVSIEADPGAKAPSSPFVLQGNCVKIW